MTPRPPESRIFGRLPDGRAVHAFTLHGSHGFEFEVLDWGATVRTLLVPDRQGSLADVALGYGSLEPYLENPPYFGSMVGRVAGRIPGATFELDGHQYPLAANDGPHHIHGGPGGFHKKLWKAEPASDRPELRLRLESPDGDEGYPGNASVEVCYAVENGSTLRIDWSVEMDRRSPVALTNHLYFNLAGDGRGDITDHVFRIWSKEYAPMDASFVPLGHRAPVVPDRNDLREPKAAADFLGRIHASHGDYYFLDSSIGGEPVLAGEVFHPASGRTLTVYTNDAGVQFYTGAMLKGAGPGKSGAIYPNHAGFCLECQGCAASVLHPELGSIIAEPGVPLKRTILFSFSTQP